ncbi:MAG: tetratricopeptide repeat protein [Wenzhouxiangella sp.]|nr:MAG: tetratricopeptide repeat protein [Wenzhouxiangella sp.]
MDQTLLPEDRLMSVFAAASSGISEPLAEGVTLRVGAAGSGKADQLLASARAAGGWTFFHHAGLGGESHNPELFLWRLLGALRRHCGFRDTLPMDAAVMREALPNWLARAAAGGGVSIVLADAQELSTGGLEPSLDWLPSWLPKGVRIALSTRPGPSAELFRDVADQVVEPAAATDLAQLRGQLRGLLDDALAREVMEYLWAARGGLGRGELAALTGSDVSAALERLAPFTRSDGEHWILAGDWIRETAASRRLADHGERQRLHQRLAEHKLARPEQEILLLQIWHLAAAGRQDLLPDALLSPRWLGWMVEPSLRFESLRYWRRAGKIEPIVEQMDKLAETGELGSAGMLGMVRLATAIADRPCPRSWLSQGLALSVSDSADADKAAFMELLGTHPDTAEPERLQWLKEALALREAEHGASHTLTAGLRHQLAVHHEEQDDLASARTVYRAGIVNLEERGAERNAELIPWLNNLAGVHKALGELKEADELLRRALKLAREELGQGHPTTASCCDQLAGVQYMAGQYETAEGLYREALEITEAAFGPDHAATAAGLNNLATVLDARQQYAQAEKLYRRALQMRLSLHGEHHSDTASSLHNLATALEASGKTDEAEQLFRRALDAWDKISGQDSAAFATTLLGLADLLRDRGAWADAEALYRSDIEIWRQLVGSRHPHTLSALLGLARLYVEGGKPELGEPLLLHVTETAQEVVGKTDALYMESAGLLGALLRDAGRTEEAKRVLETALAAQSDQLGMLTAPAQKLRRLLESLNQRPQKLH